MKRERGCVHVYTGNGKGKTTAALGLALRAVGAGMTVFFAQFLKSETSSEWHAFAQLTDAVTHVHYGTGRFIMGAPTAEEKAAARKGFAEARQALMSGEYDLVVLDELAVAVYFGLVPIEDVLALISEKPPLVELVITGRNADPALIDAADLVTEMREVKHYYAAGIAARKGIEH